MKHTKDMMRVYEKTSTIDLIKNRNRKVAQLNRLSGVGGYFVKKERSRLAHMIDQIDAVIEARRLQNPLF